MADQYCHPIDVSLAVMGEFERVDDLGKLTKDGVIRREILTQSGVILGKLQENYGTDLLDQTFWQSPPFSHPSENSENATPKDLAICTLASSIGHQQITLTFEDASLVTIRGTSSGLIASSVDTTSDYDANGITWDADDWTGIAEAGDIIYVLGYLAAPIIVGIAAKLTACELVEQHLRKQSGSEEVPMLKACQRRWTGFLNELRNDKMTLGGRSYIEGGFHAILPQWNVTELGSDASKYRNWADSGAIGEDG